MALGAPAASEKKVTVLAARRRLDAGGRRGRRSLRGREAAAARLAMMGGVGGQVDDEDPIWWLELGRVLNGSSCTPPSAAHGAHAA
jgi:hypothetical protein